MFTLRSEHLVWLGAGHTRGHGALDLFGLFERYTGTLVSDDYNGYSKYQPILTARQLCNAHLIRSATGVVEAEPRLQAWATAMIEVLRAGRKAVKDATGAGRDALNSQEIEQIRAAYREQAQIGITANYRRRTGKGGKHPAWVLAQRFLDKIDMVLHHLTDFTVPWTSDLAEQALRHVKIHLKIFGCFRSLRTPFPHRGAGHRRRDRDGPGAVETENGIAERAGNRHAAGNCRRRRPRWGRRHGRGCRVRRCSRPGACWGW